MQDETLRVLRERLLNLPVYRGTPAGVQHVLPGQPEYLRRDAVEQVLHEFEVKWTEESAAFLAEGTPI